MNSGYKKILNNHSPSAIDELVSNVEDTVENGYQAYKVGRNSKPETMLELNLKGQKTQLFYYFEIRNIIFEGDSLISIIRPHEIITIKGEYLYQLREYFRDNRVQSLNEFDPSKYDEITKTNKPFIEEIIITLPNESNINNTN